MRSTRTFALVIFAALSMPWAAPTAATERGLITLAALQTARLNVVNLRPAHRAPPPNPCVVALGFVDLSGAPFLDRAGRPVASEVRLEPGTSTFLE
jgi:hypothetical protein